MFLKELPEQLLAPADELDWSQVEEFVQLRRESTLAASLAGAPADFRRRKSGDRFRSGDRVEHPLLGPGRILRVESVGGDQKMRLLFDDGTEQTLYARFAQLDPLPPAADS